MPLLCVHTCGHIAVFMHGCVIIFRYALMGAKGLHVRVWVCAVGAVGALRGAVVGAVCGGCVSSARCEPHTAEPAPQARLVIPTGLIGGVTGNG